LLSGSLSTPSAKQAFVEIDGAELLATQSVAGVSTITFSNLNTYSAYDHLEIHAALSTTSGVYNRMRFNSDSSSIYTAKGTIATSGGVTSNDYPGSSTLDNAPLPRNADQTTSANYFSVIIPYFNNTSATKNYLSYGGGFHYIATNEPYFENMAGHWGSTSAITSITFYMASGTWLTGSKMSLYGWRNT
jgi:hypothetical protein